MTAEDQIKAIVSLLAPDQPNSVDALFLVERMLKKSSDQLKTKDKQIALLEEQVGDLQKNVRDLANRNLAAEARHQEEVQKAREELQAEVVNQKPQIKGKTL